MEKLSIIGLFYLVFLLELYPVNVTVGDRIPLFQTFFRLCFPFNQRLSKVGIFVSFSVIQKMTIVFLH